MIIPFHLLASKTPFRALDILPRKSQLCLRSAALRFLKPGAVHALALLLIAGFPPLASANVSGNLAPLAQIHGLPLPDPVLTADLRADNRSLISSAFNITTVSQQFNEGNESLLIDGEILRLDLTYHYRLDLPQTWQRRIPISRPTVSVRLPYIHHGQGFLDNGIEKWHEWFGLPNGNRDQRPDNVLAYFYQRDGQTLLDFSKEQGGIGDATLAFSFVAFEHAFSGQQLDISIAAKLPTGDEDKLTGSGGTDYFFSLTSYNLLPLQRYGIDWSGTFYLIRLDQSGPLESITRSEAAAGKLRFNWAPADTWRWFVNLDYNESLHRSNLKPLGEDSLTGTFGAARSTDQSTLSIYFSEDLYTDRSQDFSLGVSWSRQLSK